MSNEEIIEQVWSKAIVVSNNDPNIWRKDYAGAWIKRDLYDNKSEYGWQISHIKPIEKGGTEDISNLLPLQYSNNLAKSNDYPKWKTNKTAEGVHNEDKEQSWIWQE